MRVMGVDAGETSGVCMIEVDDKTGEIINFKGWQWKDFEVVEDIELLRWDEVVVEDFRLRASSSKAMIGNSFISAQINGAIKYVMKKEDKEPVIQQPAQKEFFTNDLLKKLGFYIVGEQHSRDAIRHALYYLFFTARFCLWRC